MGTSSSLFNAAITTFGSSNSGNFFSSALRKILEALVAKFSESDLDISIWKPNPFYQFNKKTNLNALDKELDLVDGGEDGQNIPFHPLIQPNRNVDVIFAVDSSADTNSSFPTKNSAQNWPAGLALIATYQRSIASISNGTSKIQHPIYPHPSTTNTSNSLPQNPRRKHILQPRAKQPSNLLRLQQQQQQSHHPFIPTYRLPSQCPLQLQLQRLDFQPFLY